MVYYVSKNGSDSHDGSEKAPFLTIQKAADTALPGDTVIVCEGTYRERVCPPRGGFNDIQRITYKAQDGDRVVIKGSEEVSGWISKEDIWYTAIDNRIFCGENPFVTELKGDWIAVHPGEPYAHTAAVYIDGEPLTEIFSKDNISKSNMCWFVAAGDKITEIYANFGKKNPCTALVEVNARSCCFAPMASGINYITVSGFEMAHAATQWAPPTGKQEGAVWARWCKGWIIENNTIHHSRCSGISLGRDGTLGDNPTLTLKRKSGFRNQLELVFKSVKNGWSKERIGSHTVRNNTIHSCGQTGIVGHMGGAFSQIYRNHIHDIGLSDLDGAEIAGIKLHAAIDTYIHHNLIHNTKRGLWLDWQAQGARVSSNVFYNNTSTLDMYAEVTHGPLLIDNNIFASPFSVQTKAQGCAFINNWFGGKFTIYKDLDRYTPYHVPHSTDVLGCAMIYGGDDRICNNIFAGTGTDCYNGMHASYEAYVEYINQKSEFTMPGFYGVTEFTDNGQPVYISNNIYAGDAVPFEKEVSSSVYKSGVDLVITEETDGVYATLKLPDSSIRCKTIRTHELPAVRMTEGLFESPDGKDIILDLDITGKRRKAMTVPGPIAHIGIKQKVF